MAVIKGLVIFEGKKNFSFIFAIMELTVISAQFVTSARMVGGKLSFTLAVHKVWSTNIITLVVDLFPRQASVPLLESEQCPVQ